MMFSLCYVECSFAVIDTAIGTLASTRRLVYTILMWIVNTS